MENSFLSPVKKLGRLFASSRFQDTKDPCLVFDGQIWHIFGSGGSITYEGWQILHATAPTIEGPWFEEEPAILEGLSGPHVAAPGVVYDKTDKKFHMAIQEDFMSTGSSIHYLSSSDGQRFKNNTVILSPIAKSGESGLYDPHFSLINGKKYMVYAGMPDTVPGERAFVPQPDIYLAESESWAGPWKRVGKILDHDDIAWHHNRRDYHDYEWGIEGPQLAQLSDGSVLLNATCFLEKGRRGTRQRVFFARSTSVAGPYKSFGPVLEDQPLEEWESGENGHASVYIDDNGIYLCYQARPATSKKFDQNNWAYGLAMFDPGSLVTDFPNEKLPSNI